MKIPLSQTREFNRGAYNGNVYVEKKDQKGFKLFTVHCEGSHPKVRFTGAVRAYLIREGAGTFTTNGEKEIAQRDDLFLVSDGDTFEYEGKMKLIAFDVPATDTSNEEKIP